jgi:uncharacterized membrane protein YfcA
LNRFADDADAADECGSNKGLTVKIRCIRPIREPISSVLLLGINSFQKVSRHQLFATLLFMAQEPLKRWLRLGESHEAHKSANWMLGASCYQFLVGVYGGYFGAGIGILTLAVLGVLGLENIHQMNALKNIFAGSINLVAAVYFIYAGLIHWPEAILMSIGAIIGGYGAAGLARRMGQRIVRRIVIFIGFAMTVSLLLKR